MAAKRRRSSGQSLIEFVLMLPVFIGMLFLLVRVNSAIQVSIVNQKYSRQRLFELVGNSPQYPALGSNLGRLVSIGDNRMVVGVSEESTLSIEDGFQPSAPTQVITRTRGAAAGGSEEAGKEPNRRAKVRIRNTVELCTPVLAEKSNGGIPRPIQDGLVEKTFERVTFCTGGIDE